MPAILACIALLMATVTLFTYRRLPSLVVKAVKRHKARGTSPGGYPPVSVVVYTCNNAPGLAALIPQLLGQDYPADYEIIVVNDGRDDATETLVSSLAGASRRIYHTFTPHGTRNLSRKKLALMLGIKAAAHEAIVHITSETRLESSLWLREMARPLGDGHTDIVIGYTVADDNARGARHRAHDRLVDTVHYLSAAIAGHAYRGNGDNLAYRKSTFFSLKGFSNSLNLHYGDDDIFIYDAATPTNTAVAVAPEARVTVNSDDPVASYRYAKVRHAFTARYAGCKRHILYGIFSAVIWTWLIATVAALVLAPLNPLIAVALLTSAIILWVPMMRSWYLASRYLGSRRFLFSVPGYFITRPLCNLGFLLKSKKIHDTQYAWHSTS